MDYCELNAVDSLSSNYKATEEIIHHVAAWTDYHDHAESLPGKDNTASHHTPRLMLGICWLCRAGRGKIVISIADPVCLHETWLSISTQHFADLLEGCFFAVDARLGFTLYPLSNTFNWWKFPQTSDDLLNRLFVMWGAPQVSCKHNADIGLCGSPPSSK